MLGWELPPHNSGGLGVACYHLAESLAKKGANISFVLPYDADHDVDFMEVVPATTLGPAAMKFGSYDSRTVDEKGEFGLSMREIQRLYGEFIREYLEREEVDAVHAHDWLTLEAGVIARKEYGVPLIAHVHATEFDRAGGGLGNPLIHEIEREGLMMADEVLAVSGLTKRIIEERYGIPGDKIRVAHNGFNANDWGVHDYDPSRYKYLESLRRQGRTIVATTARLTVQKGIGYLIDGFAVARERHPEMTLVIAGDGEQRDELLRISAEKGVSEDVLFTGFIRGRELRDIYSVCDVFVMSSCSEPFGLTAFEAAHHDAALILTRQSGAGEVLHNALKYDYWDTHRLADTLYNIASSPGLQRDMRRSIGREYTKLPWDKVADLILNSYWRWAR